MPSFQRENTEIYYEEYGEGQPLILSYGLAGNTGMWKPQIDAFRKDHRLILWDQRGHGKSDSPEDPNKYGVWVSVEDLNALTDQLDLKEAYIGGQSMGGGVAARFALKYPHKTKALLVFNSHSASGLNSSPERRAMRQRSIEIVQQEGMKAMAEFAMREDPNIAGYLQLHPDSLEEATAEIRAMFLALNPIGYVNSIIAARNSDDISDQLGQIKVPTLLVTGDRDPVLKSMLYVRGRIKQAVLKVVSCAGHHANLDNPKEFNAVVLDFLGQLKK